MAEDRVVDAKVLLDASRWSAAYYIAGYAVECGLKACVLARVENSGVIFDDPKFATQVRTHKLDDLIKLAGLEQQFGAAKQGNPSLLTNWGVASAWTEESRYQVHIQQQAEQLFEAITKGASNNNFQGS
jgi:hypothetical protein